MMNESRQELLAVLDGMGIDDPQLLRQLLLLALEVGSGQVDYTSYIKSPQWRQVAKAAKARAGWRCQLCNRPSSEVALHAHHRTYERLGQELPEDLTVLCIDCHELYESGGRTGRYIRGDVHKELQKNQVPQDLEHIIKR